MDGSGRPAGERRKTLDRWTILTIPTPMTYTLARGGTPWPVGTPEEAPPETRASHAVIPDRIETGTYIAACAIAGGEIEICACQPAHLRPVIEKLRELESIGVDEWITYLMTHDQEETLEAYGRDVIPALASS